MIRKDNEPIFQSLLCGRYLSWNFFKYFLIQTFQQPHDSGTDEETEAQRGPVVCYGHTELTAGVTKGKHTQGLFFAHWVVLKPIYVMKDPQVIAIKGHNNSRPKDLEYNPLHSRGIWMFNEWDSDNLIGIYAKNKKWKFPWNGT